MKLQYIRDLEIEISLAYHCESQARFVDDTDFARQWEIYRLQLTLEFHKVSQMSRAEYAAYLYWTCGKVPQQQAATQLSLF